MTASNLIMEKLDEIKELTNSELALIDQLSVKVLPDKVVNQSERLKGAFINPVTSVNGLPKYLAIRLEAINEILKEIQTNWNSTLPEATTHIDTIQSKLDELYNGVNEEYNTLLKIENAIKKEVSDRETAITNLINGASEDFNTLQEIETKVKQEISDREQAIINLINGASSGYDTLKELETAIKKEVTDREQAITDLINNATANYNTLGKLETRIKEETANRNNAISALKGTATSSNDTLGKLETNLNNEISNREDAIETLINNASSGYQTLKELEDKIKAEVTARTQAITKEINDRNSAIQAAISNLVDTAPDLLNTLDELAAALGDDPNFATTVANNIAQSLTTAKAYTDTKISEEESARDTAISGAISNLKGTATTNYDTLAKLEARIKEEVTNRTSAINSLIGGATESYNTLKELEDAIKTEVTNRTEAISDLIGTANSSYDTLGKIQARIEAISGTEGEGLTIESAITKSMNYTDKKVAEETSARNNAINSLKNGASSGYDTLKELESAIKAEASNRASAITQEVSDRNSAITEAINNLKGTAESGYDTLGELQNAITNQKTALENSISQAKTEVKNELLDGAGAAFDTLNELAKALGNDPNFSTTVSNLIAQKQNKLTETQLNAVNSGITQAKVAKYDGYETTINSKQNALNSTQQNAINSGITQAKVVKYDGYETTINNKANASEVVKKANLGENVDFNDVTEGGMYRYNTSVTNGPDGAHTHGQLLVVRGAEDTIAQLCFPYGSSRMFLRTGNAINNPNGTWKGWVEIANTSVLNNYLPLSGGTINGFVTAKGFKQSDSSKNYLDFYAGGGQNFGVSGSDGTIYYLDYYVQKNSKSTIQTQESSGGILQFRTNDDYEASIGFAPGNTDKIVIGSNREIGYKFGVYNSDSTLYGDSVSKWRAIATESWVSDKIGKKIWEGRSTDITGLNLNVGNLIICKIWFNRYSASNSYYAWGIAEIENSESEFPILMTSSGTSSAVILGSTFYASSSRIRINTSNFLNYGIIKNSGSVEGKTLLPTNNIEIRSIYKIC